MSLGKHASLNDQISHEAAEWLVELRTGDLGAGGRRKFDAWLRTSPQHIRAFIEMATLWHESGSVDSDRQVDIDRIIAQDRTRTTPSLIDP